LRGRVFGAEVRNRRPEGREGGSAEKKGGGKGASPGEEKKGWRALANEKSGGVVFPIRKEGKSNGEEGEKVLSSRGAVTSDTGGKKDFSFSRGKGGRVPERIDRGPGCFLRGGRSGSCRQENPPGR